MSIVGFGDLLMHFSPLEYERMLQSDFMKLSFTGAEANVCAALSLWGEDVEFVTKLPKHQLAQKSLIFLNGLGIKTNGVVLGDGRMGIYFLEKGYSLRPSYVIYDRHPSAFTGSCFEDYDWSRILDHANAFYLSGITPSLSETLFDCCKKVLAAARKKNIPVFYDVNLRPALCDIYRSRQIFNELCPFITNLIGNEEHLKQLLEINTAEIEDPGRLYNLTQEITAVTKIKNIAITVRRTPSANRAVIYASLSDGNSFAVSQARSVDVIDRVGSGDAFSSAIVYSALHHYSVEKSVEFATASSALKHTINNDINFSSLSEITNLMEKSNLDVCR